jgi:hypothetical protein
MFNLKQVQYIFDYAMLSFYQCAEKPRPEAVKRAAQVAAAATTMVDKEANMANKAKDAVLTAGLEAVTFNIHLTGEAHREAFDIQFAISLKIGLEKLFCIENISAYDKTSTKAPKLPVATNKIQATSVEPKSNVKHQFFSAIIPSQQHYNDANEPDNSSQGYPFS